MSTEIKFIFFKIYTGSNGGAWFRNLGLHNLRKNNNNKKMGVTRLRPKILYLGYQIVLKACILINHAEFFLMCL